MRVPPKLEERVADLSGRLKLTKNQTTIELLERGLATMEPPEKDDPAEWVRAE
jgi:hypothetical protein